MKSIYKNKVFFIKIVYVALIAFFIQLPQSSLAAEKSINLGYYSSFNIFGESKKNDKEGLGQDSLIELAQKANIKVNLIDLNMSFVEALTNNVVDMVGLTVPLPNLEDKVTFSKSIFGYAQFGLAAKHNKSVYYDDPKSINRKKVATFHGNNANPLFQAYLTKNNISVEYVYGNLDNYTDIEADFYLIFSSIENINDFEIVLNLGKAPLHLVVKKGNEHFLAPLDNAFASLLKNTDSVVSKIQEKFKKIDEKFNNRTLTRSEAEVLEGKTFTVGFIKNNPPYQYLDEQGTPKGISIEVLNTLAAKYKFNVKYVPYEIKNGTCSVNHDIFDMIISLKGNSTNVRENYRATNPFNHVQMIMLIAFAENKSIREILKENNKIGMLPNIAFDYSELYRTIPSAQIKYYDNFEFLLDAFKSGDVNAAIFTSTDATFAHVVNKNKSHLYPLGIALPIQFYIANKHAQTLVPIFNTMLKNISYDSLYEINFKHTADFAPVFTIKEFIIEYWIYILAVICTLLLILTAYIMRAQINKKNEFLKMLYSDELTSLISMRYFRMKVQTVLETAKSDKYELIVLDIDYFRMVNKHYGMEAGTQVIREMGDCLINAYADTNAIISRKHSEQFVIFKEKSEGRDIKYVVSVLLESAIKKIVGKNFSLTMSIGIYPIVKTDEEINDMLDFADIARKRGKAYHKFTYITFNEKMRHNYYETLNIVYRMESALRDEEFKIVFQPKVCFETLKIIGAEALVRWIPTDGEPIYPDKFIATMETDGFISELDLYVFRKVCEFIRNNFMNYRIPKIAVNLSAVTMCEANIVEKLIAITKRYQIPPSQLEIELTESALNTFDDSVVLSLYDLKQYGFSIAMDDFGTGESSLNRLGVSNVDVLKLDKSFLDFNQDSERGKVIVEKIIDLARELNMKIVSEGVETLEQVLWLRELKCNIAQGYYFSRPVDGEAFKQMLRDDITYELK